MHIFNFKEGHSLRREQQTRINQPPQYFFVFDYSEPAANATASSKTSSSLVQQR